MPIDYLKYEAPIHWKKCQMTFFNENLRVSHSSFITERKYLIINGENRNVK